jgi:Flp pilus assembly protein TadD
VIAIPAARAVDVVSQPDAPDLTSVRSKIAAKDWTAAKAELNKMIEGGVQHADVYSLMGYASRKSGDQKAAFTFYQKALEFDPYHKGALEYQGELFILTGSLAKAKDNLALLTTLCPSGCEERSDLAEAIAKAK